MENNGEQTRLKDFFKGDELPDVVYVPNGAAYYKKLEDIPEENFKNSNTTPKIDSFETRSFVVLKVSPVLPGETREASFRFRGERGLYVRVIPENDRGVPEPKNLRWVPFNRMDQEKYKRV